MPDTSRNFSVTETTPLSGFQQTWPMLSIAERSGDAFCSITARKDREQEVAAKFKAAFRITPPGPGNASVCDQGILFWTAPSQWFFETSDHTMPNFDHELVKIFEDTASITLQSDAWAQIEITGAKTLKLFERLVLLDMSQNSFPPGRAARTQMHHLNIIILHLPDQQGTYRLFSARSSAQSFLTVITQAADTISSLVKR